MDYDAYFAAPLSRQRDAMRNIKFVAELRAAGLKIFLPQELGRVCDDYNHKDTLRKKYFDLDLHALDRCTTFIMFLGREPSAGACWEMGYAYAKGKPIAGLNVSGYETGTFLSQSCEWMADMESLISWVQSHV
jgi:nucleoside 2-deoxyribosyltransferase